MIITLSDGEQRIARFLARERFTRARDAGIENRRMGPQSDEQTDLEGIGAEMAYCKMVNVWPDLSYGHRPDADALLPNGESVDVKATRWKTGRLIVALWKRNKAPDRYVLMVGEFPTYRYAGEIEAENIMIEDNIKDLGHGPVYALPQSALKNAHVHG